MQRLGICLNKIPDSCCGSLNVIVLVRSAVGSFPFLRTCNCGSFENRLKMLCNQRGSVTLEREIRENVEWGQRPRYRQKEAQQKHFDPIKSKKSSRFSEAFQATPGWRSPVLPQVICFTKTFSFMMSEADLHNCEVHSKLEMELEVKFQSVPVVTIWNMSHRVPAHVLTPRWPQSKELVGCRRGTGKGGN